tara:strand:- start:146 stop:280 length:135 start_codon:yes stop_codon:yes gene_type:complete
MVFLNLGAFGWLILFLKEERLSRGELGFALSERAWGSFFPLLWA